MNAVRALALLLLLSACTSAAAPATNPVTGAVERTIVSRGSFVLRDDAGHTFTFELDDPLVSLAHLEIHRHDRLPVIVTFRRDDGVLHATTVVDVRAPAK